MPEPLLDIRPDHLQIVRDILQKHVPQYEVWAFGSRAKWSAKEHSDLDLCILSDKPLSFSVLGAIGEDFSDSDLPWKVDVVDWATTSPSFRKIIERDKVAVQRIEVDWESVTLGDILTLQRGMDLPVQDRKNGNVPIIASNGITGYHNHAPVKAPGVVIGRSGSIGGGQYIEHDFWPLNTTLWVKDFKGNDPRYCYYLLRSIDFSGMNAGSGVPTLNRNHLHPMSMLRPPVIVQKQISSILGSLDDKITLLRETNATLEAIAQALFKSWFVNFDPVRAKMEGREPEGMNAATAALFPDSFEDSEFGEIPRGWRVGTLGEISSNVRAGAKPDELSDDTAYIGLEHMPRQSIALYEWDSASKVESGKSRFKNGHILFGKLRPYFHKVGIAPLDGVCSTDILVIQPISQAWHAFSVCHFSSKPLVEHATQLSNGAKMPRTNWSDLANYRIVIPPDELVLVFESIVSPLLKRIPETVHQAKVLAVTRDTLLPRLMSGKWRVRDAEGAIS